MPPMLSQHAPVSPDIHTYSIYNDMIAIRVPKSIVSDFYYGIPAEVGLFTTKV